MSEYDFSPEAVAAAKAKKRAIGDWVETGSYSRSFRGGAQSANYADMMAHTPTVGAGYNSSVPHHRAHAINPQRSFSRSGSAAGPPGAQYDPYGQTARSRAPSSSSSPALAMPQPRRAQQPFLPSNHVYGSTSPSTIKSDYTGYPALDQQHAPSPRRTNAAGMRKAKSSAHLDVRLPDGRMGSTVGPRRTHAIFTPTESVAGRAELRNLTPVPPVPNSQAYASPLPDARSRTKSSRSLASSYKGSATQVGLHGSPGRDARSRTKSSAASSRSCTSRATGTKLEIPVVTDDEGEYFIRAPLKGQQYVVVPEGAEVSYDGRPIGVYPVPWAGGSASPSSGRKTKSSSSRPKGYERAHTTQNTTHRTQQPPVHSLPLPPPPYVESAPQKKGLLRRLLGGSSSKNSGLSPVHLNDLPPKLQRMQSTPNF